MPSKWFICPDGEKIEIDKCLGGDCRMGERCSTLPLLRAVAFDREYRGVTASASGNGPRYIYLQAVTDYAIDPDGRMFALLGTNTHAKLSDESLNDNTLPEERMEEGTPDVLEESYGNPGYHTLSDYKTWGSYKVGLALGLVEGKNKDPVLDKNGNPELYKSNGKGYKKGDPKTKKTWVVDPTAVDMKEAILQTNQYRIAFEKKGFKIDKMQVVAIVRDGGTFVAKNRGVVKNHYVINVPRMNDVEVEKYYNNLSDEVERAFENGYARICNKWESWDGRRCDGFCNVADECKQMSERGDEKCVAIG